MTIVKGENFSGAEEKGKILSLGREENYNNCYGKNVTVSFVGVMDIQSVVDSELKDGIEVVCLHWDGPLEKASPELQIKLKTAMDAREASRPTSLGG